MVRAGALPILIAALNRGTKYCCFTATSVLAKICVDSPDVQTAAVDAGALDGLLNMLRDGRDGIEEGGGCLSCLAAIAKGKDPKILRKIIDAGCIDPVKKSVIILNSSCWPKIAGEILECLLDGRNDVKQLFVDACGPKQLVKILDCTHGCSRKWTADLDPLMRCLCHLTCSAELSSILHAVVNAGALPVVLRVVDPSTIGSPCLAH